MGRTNNFVDETVAIFVPASGKITLYRRNVRNCKCAACQKPLAPERGYKFNKFRMSDEAYPRSGYVCGECVGKALEGNPWFWNKFMFALQQPTEGETRRLDGRELAAVWFDHGLSGLAFTLERSRM